MSGKSSPSNRGRMKGGQHQKKPPDKTDQLLVRDSWTGGPFRGPSTSTSKTTTESDRKRQLQGKTSPSGKPPASKVRLDNPVNEDKRHPTLQEARQSFRSTSAVVVARLSPSKSVATSTAIPNTTPTAEPEVPNLSQSRESIPESTAPTPPEHNDESGDESDGTTTVVLHVELSDFNKISVISIANALRALSFDPFKFKATKDGKIKVTVNQDKVSAIKNLETFMGRNVISVTEEVISSNSGPRDYIWGKFFSHDLINCEDGEVLEELQRDNDNITEAKRIYKGRDKQRTRLIKVKFNSYEIPKKNYCLGVSYDIIPFIPPVKKCYKCNQYNNHWTADCKNDWVCQSCNKKNCPSQSQNIPCPNSAHCKYCGPGHSTKSSTCPRYLKEREIVNISFEKNISFQNARNKVESGEISGTTVAKLPSPSNLPSQSNSSNTIRSGISWSEIAKANVVRKFTDASTGSPESESDSIGSDSMAKDIDETLADPGELKQISPSPWLFTGFDEPIDNQNEIAEILGFFRWIDSASNEKKFQFKNLLRKVLICSHMIMNDVKTHQPDELLNINIQNV